MYWEIGWELQDLYLIGHLVQVISILPDLAMYTTLTELHLDSCDGDLSIIRNVLCKMTSLKEFQINMIEEKKKDDGSLIQEVEVVNKPLIKEYFWNFPVSCETIIINNHRDTWQTINQRIMMMDLNSQLKSIHLRNTSVNLFQIMTDHSSVSEVGLGQYIFPFNSAPPTFESIESLPKIHWLSLTACLHFNQLPLLLPMTRLTRLQLGIRTTHDEYNQFLGHLMNHLSNTLEELDILCYNGAYKCVEYKIDDDDDFIIAYGQVKKRENIFSHPLHDKIVMHKLKDLTLNDGIHNALFRSIYAPKLENLTITNESYIDISTLHLQFPSLDTLNIDNPQSSSIESSTIYTKLIDLCITIRQEAISPASILEWLRQCLNLKKLSINVLVSDDDDKRKVITDISDLVHQVKCRDGLPHKLTFLRLTSLPLQCINDVVDILLPLTKLQSILLDFTIPTLEEYSTFINYTPPDPSVIYSPNYGLGKAAIQDYIRSRLRLSTPLHIQIKISYLN